MRLEFLCHTSFLNSSFSEIAGRDVKAPRVEENFISLVKGVHHKTAHNIMLKDQKLDYFPKTGHDSMSTLTLPSQDCNVLIAGAIRKTAMTCHSCQIRAIH